MSEVMIPLKRHMLQGGKAKSYKSSSNDQGNKHATKRASTPKEKELQARNHVPMVKGILGKTMKVSKMPLDQWEQRYTKETTNA